jgi:hypothetical protein
MKIGEDRIGNSVKGSCRVLTWDNSLEFEWRDCKNTRRASREIAEFRVTFRNGILYAGSRSAAILPSFLVQREHKHVI